MGSPLLLRQVYSPKFNIKKIPLHISGDSWTYSCFQLMTMMAERVGFEPTHALTRLADFESAPLDLLGTFPQHN